MKISLSKYHQLNAAIRQIRDFCVREGGSCVDCLFWKETKEPDVMGLHHCILNDTLPEDWEELPKEVLDKE